MHAREHYDARQADLFAVGVAAYCLAVGAYPWDSTRPGRCKSFDFARARGLEALLARKRVRSAGGAVPVEACLSPEMKELLLTLLNFEPLERTSAAVLLKERQLRLNAQPLVAEALIGA